MRQEQLQEADTIYTQVILQTVVYFLLNNPNKVQELPKDFGGAKCPKFNLVGQLNGTILNWLKKLQKHKIKN